jgi:hypothetical protein
MDQMRHPTTHLYRPEKGNLISYQSMPANRETNRELAKSVTEEIKALVSQRNYPCVAALRSYHKDDYQVGFYGKLGEGKHWRELRNDLLFFLQEQRRTSSIYLSFWAVFEEEELSEADFETLLWKELSFLTSEEDRKSDWPADSIQDPTDPGFRFGLGGAEFFVVGLHSQSSRHARRFSKPALIFNIFSQFDQLVKLGQYESMVALNRERDQKFQGSVNPMVALHGEIWESIQFSGKINLGTWKCPFSFLKSLVKP